MAVSPSPSSPTTSSRPPASKSSFFQKKELGLPVWGWVLIVGGVAVAYVVYTRMHSGSASTAPATQTVTPSGAGGGSGGGYGFGTGGGGGSGTTVPGPQDVQPYVPPSSPGNPALPFQVQSGSGWWAGGSNWATDTPAQQAAATAKAQAAGPITDAAGNEYEWLDPAEYNSMKNSGIQVYYEILPGVFIPVPTALAGLAPGTPLYMQIPAGTGANPSSSSTSSSQLATDYQNSALYRYRQQQKATA